MAKKRKTREQKKLADLRHTFTHSVVNQTPPEAKIQLKTENIIKPQIRTQATSINAYPYLAKDLSKTAVLTAAILISQVILFSLLKNHTLMIPGLSY